MVVGASMTSDSSMTHAFHWDSGNGMIDLGTLNNNDSSAWAINNLGKVVGTSVIGPDGNSGQLSLVGGVNHAFIWTHEEGMVDIHDSSYNSSMALGINDADQVVGVIAGNIIVDHLRGNFDFSPFHVIPINDHRPLKLPIQIDIPITNRIAPLQQPMQIASLTPNTLELLPPDLTNLPDPIKISHMESIRIPISKPYNSAAFLWDKKHGMINLNDMLDGYSRWDFLVSAKDINYKGQIIGTGFINGEEHAFLMNPIIPAIPAEVEIRPGTINLSGRGKFNCNIELPEDDDVAEINTDSILLADAIEPDQVRVDKRRQVVTARFDRKDLRNVIEAGEVELTVTGELADGTKFEGAATIRVIDRAVRAKRAATRRHRRSRK